jgi:hypothetical protein
MLLPRARLILDPLAQTASGAVGRLSGYRSPTQGDDPASRFLALRRHPIRPWTGAKRSRPSPTAWEGRAWHASLPQLRFRTTDGCWRPIQHLETHSSDGGTPIAPTLTPGRNCATILDGSTQVPEFGLPPVSLCTGSAVYQVHHIIQSSQEPRHRHGVNNVLSSRLRAPVGRRSIGKGVVTRQATRVGQRLDRRS